MIRKMIESVISRYGWWKLSQVLTGGACLVFLVIFGFEFLLPSRADVFESDINFANTSGDGGDKEISDQSANYGFSDISGVLRGGMFKAGAGLAARPAAEKTIERIRSTLKLQCIMDVAGETVAYVNVKGQGLKKCCEGDSVDDLFKVLNIYKRSMEISIIDHKVTLYL